MATPLIQRDAGLARIYAVRQALAKASTIPAVKQLRDAAEAAEIYAKRQQLGEEIENFAYQIKMEALGKLGGLLKKAREAGELNRGTRGQGRPRLGGTRAAPPKDRRRTLADLHLTKKLSSAAQQFAQLSPQEQAAVARKQTSLPDALREARRRRGQRPSRRRGGRARAWGPATRDRRPDEVGLMRADWDVDAFTAREFRDCAPTTEAIADGLNFLFQRGRWLDLIDGIREVARQEAARIQGTTHRKGAVIVKISAEWKEWQAPQWPFEGDYDPAHEAVVIWVSRVLSDLVRAERIAINTK